MDALGVQSVTESYKEFTFPSMSPTGGIVDEPDSIEVLASVNPRLVTATSTTQAPLRYVNYWNVIDTSRWQFSLANGFQ